MSGRCWECLASRWSIAGSGVLEVRRGDGARGSARRRSDDAGRFCDVGLGRIEHEHIGEVGDRANLKEAVRSLLASRRLSRSPTSPMWFVFDTAETYVGRICQHHRYGVEHFPLHRHHAALRARQSRQMLHLTRDIPAAARHRGSRPFRPDALLHKQSSVFPSFLNDGEWSCRFHDGDEQFAAPEVIQKGLDTQCRGSPSLSRPKTATRFRQEATRQVATMRIARLFR